MLPTITVRGTGIAKIPYVELDERGQPRHVLGRFAGRDAKGEPRTEVVPLISYYHRAVCDGELLLVDPAAAPAVAPETSTAAPAAQE